ncbi:hypothetical protein C6571_09620 [Simplicispira suum]|uniref:Uncharacterized protein n=1 Tax=Simplicispira suum TaxID=2109915 RepID=A0A2S0N0E0_9BURK|nr:hypothetical protein C6571_09620 [Simplicispira suum]
MLDVISGGDVGADLASEEGPHPASDTAKPATTSGKNERAQKMQRTKGENFMALLLLRERITRRLDGNRSNVVARDTVETERIVAVQFLL